jgi:hypothetical protein
MIEVRVREDDGIRRRIAKVLARPPLCASGGSIQGGVDQGPPRLSGHREEVDEEHPQADDIRRDGVERNNGALWDLNAFHTASRCNCSAGRRVVGKPPQ